MILRIDTDAAFVEIVESTGTRRIPFADPEAFELVSRAWVRVGWDTKYVYRFTWLGRPIIQLPEDIVRLQELVFHVQPDVVVETGIAHGGSLILYASVFEALGKGHVIGVDIELRAENRSEIEGHPLSHRITLVDGNSVEATTVARVREAIGKAETVLVVLDSKHSKEHVLEELRLYGGFVTPGSCIVVADGVMREVAGAPRTSPDWSWNNPIAAVEEFLAENDSFTTYEPMPLFDESDVRTPVTYFQGGWLRRIK